MAEVDYTIFFNGAAHHDSLSSTAFKDQAKQRGDIIRKRHQLPPER